MTGSRLKLTLNTIGTLLARGDADELATYFECPLPVYVDDRFILFGSRDQLAEALAAYMIEVSRFNVHRIEPLLVRIEDTTPSRSLFVVRWNYLLEDGTCCSSNVVRYVGRRGALDGTLRIELVEYLDTTSSDFPMQLLEVFSA